MSQFNKSFGSSRGPEDSNHRRDWLKLFFSGEHSLDTRNIHWVPNGPLGSSRLASVKELLALKEAGQNDSLNYLQLLPAYAIAHNPGALAVDMGPLALPLGSDSPNVLVVGRAGSGKTQTVTLPTALHALRCGWSMVYINVKGAKQTRFLRRIASCYGRSSEIKLVSPLKLKRTIACTLLEGCDSLSKANEVAEVMVAAAARNSRDGGAAWCYNQAQEFALHAIAAICSDLPKSRRNLNEIRKVVVTGSYQAFAEEHPDFPVLGKFARYVAEGNINAGTVSAAISESTSFIDEISEFLSKDELSLEAFAQDGGCLIIEIDQADIKRLRPIVTLLLARLVSSLQRAANSSSSGCLPHKTVIIIDELIASGPVPGLPEVLHTCRELGFCFVAGAQSISQLQSIYGYEAQSVLDGFQTQIAIAGGLDLLTAEHFSRRAGVATIALPGRYEPGDFDENLTLSRNLQLSSRPVLLPSDIASPYPHADLGMPATIIAGDGKTPPFQAYLTPCYQEGSLARLQDEVAAQSQDDDLRPSPLKKPRASRNKKASTIKSAEPNLPAGISNTKGWSEDKLRSKLDQVLQAVDWESTTGSARSWWEDFINHNQNRIALVLRLAEELALRKATIAEFFLAYVYSNTDNIQGNLFYLDFTRLKREEDKQKRKATEDAKAKNNETGPAVDGTHFDIFADQTPATSSESKATPTELTFVRCSSCRSLVPSKSMRCQVCGHTMRPSLLVDINSTEGFEIVLTSFGSSMLAVVKVVKSATGKSLMDSKKLVESAPTSLGCTRTRENAARVVQEIQDAGGQANIA